MTKHLILTAATVLAAATGRAGDACDWVPFAANPWVEPGTAADASSWTDIDAPAGRHGRVVVRGDHFEFEGLPNVPQRFLGANVILDAVTPKTADDARAFARLLRRLGWNAVRIHQHEQDLVGADGFSLDPAKMRRFDAFVAACIAEGLYLQTDLYVTRKVKGYDLHGFKEKIVCGDETAFTNYLAWAKAFLTHRNAETGRTLCEEPALAFVTLINEDNVGNRKHVARENGWEQRAAECHRAFIRRMRGILRDELGCRALISDLNGWTYKEPYFPVIAEECDYVDSHGYVDHPVYVGAAKFRLPSRMNDTGPWSFPFSYARHDISGRFPDKPFLCTEWSWSAPGRWRGAGGLLQAAYACERGWDGLWHYCWGSHGIVGQPFGSPDAPAHPVHYWDMARDPFALAAERAVSALFLRGDGFGASVSNDLKKAVWTLSAMRTCGAVVRRGRFTAGALAGDAGEDGAIVWATTCDGRSFAESSRVLVTHLTQLRNTGIVLSGEKSRVLEDWGSLPYLVKRGAVRLSLALGPGAWRVWRLDAAGRRRSEVATSRADGRLRFTADVAGDSDNATILYEAVREGLVYGEDPVTGAMTRLEIANDQTGMNWVHSADNRQFPWVGPEFGWGLGTVKVDGEKGAWSDFPGRLKVDRSRRLDGGDVLERYVFRNVSDRPITLSEIDVNASFNDNYPKDGVEMLTRRCHAHVWAGGCAGWVAAMRIGGAPPHVGLMMTEGELAAYEVKERAPQKGFSNVRGILCLSPRDTTLAPGESMAVGWRLFVHGGWDDFFARLVARGGSYVRAGRWCASVGETIPYEFVTATGTVRRTWTCDRVGRQEVAVPCGDGKTTKAEFLGLPDIPALLLARARFIVAHQQVLDEGSPWHGALVPYDNETGRQYRNWELPKERRRVDTSEGGERHGMGIFLAQMAQRGHRDELLPAAVRYADFVRHRLQEPDFTLYQEVNRPSRNRSYNYPWAATLYLEMHRLTGERKYAEWAYGTLRRLFTGGGISLPDTLVDLPVKDLVETLRAAGMRAEADEMMEIFRSRLSKHVDPEAGLVMHEVGICPEQVAGFLCQLLDMHELTGEPAYLDAARRMAPATDAMLPRQPSANLHDMALHHWDGYWFGKRRMWGDTCPQDWNGAMADFFRRWADVTGDGSFRRRADEIVRQLLMLFDPDGRAYCVFIYPDRVDGKPGKFRDPLANDQDWALVFYLRNFR